MQVRGILCSVCPGYRGSCIHLLGAQVASRALSVFSVLGSISQIFSPCLGLAPALSPSHSPAWPGRAGVLTFYLCARAPRALPGLAVPAMTQDLMSAPSSAMSRQGWSPTPQSVLAMGPPNTCLHPGPASAGAALLLAGVVGWTLAAALCPATPWGAPTSPGATTQRVPLDSAAPLHCETVSHLQTRLLMFVVASRARRISKSKQRKA